MNMPSQERIVKPTESGIFFHCHHERVAEYVWDAEERRRYIREHKPEEEQELRLKLFRRVPPGLIPDSVVRALAAYDEARAAYAKARAARVVKARAARVVKAWAALDEARDAYDKAWDAVDWEGIHRQGCLPDCPWNGQTIFPEVRR